MRIDNEHLYHGAAVIQIAEDPHFTSINAIKRRNGALFRSAYRVNRRTAVYLKYATTRPRGGYKQVQFTFPRRSIRELRELKARRLRVFLGLVCVKARAICCVPLADFMTMLDERRAAAGHTEDQYTLHVGIPKRKWFRVCVAYPGSHGYVAGDEGLYPRRNFPGRLFEP